MHYGILGTTRALRADGSPVALGGTRLRALLTVLAMRPGRTVPAGVLVDEVWGADPPADAPGALQALVGRLRRALGRDAVASATDGYRLVAEPEAVDLHRFDRLVGRGARALEQGDTAEATAVLDEALGLWRGPALADLPDRAVEAARWDARRLDARRTRIEAVLAQGRTGDALPELAALCADHPLDEPLQTLRITALRDAGRTAQALAAYEEVRTLLADRLGSDPGPALRALHVELLRQDAPAAEPARPAPTAAGRQGNLRARLTSFVGREADIAALGQDLTRSRLVTLLGPGGAGKTRLSQEAAESVDQAAWPDGVWLAELAPVDDPEAVPEAVLTALGGRETVLRGAGAEELRAAERGPGERLARLTEHCAGRRMLLLLDNCEHLIEAAALLAEHLLAHCPGLTVLATSREPLGVPGEFLRPVEPLPDATALRLFSERGSAVRPGFRTDADERSQEACAEICRRLDGLPLAIELAAARLRMLTPRQIADRLDDRFRLLTAGSRTVLPRQQTLRAVVDWSWDLLDEDERTVLRRLSVFSGGCSLVAAEEVCAGSPEGARDVAAVLGSLVDKSLVVAAPDDSGEMRFRLLETVGEYAAERLDEAAEREYVERRHLVFHRELARTRDPELRGAGQLAVLDLFQREYENLRTALRRAVAARDEQESLSLVLSLAWYWQMRDLRDDALHWAEAVGALGPDPFAPPGERAPSLTERCTDAPPPMRPELLQEARRQVALMRMATMDHGDDDWTDEAGQARLRVIADTYTAGQPQTCRSPGSLWFFAVMFTGDAGNLRDLLDERVRASRDFGYDWELAAALQVRANVLANWPHWAADARKDSDESLAIFRHLGDDWGAAEALSSRGEAAEKTGDYAGAAEDYLAAIGYAEKIGARSQVLVLRTRYAATLSELGRVEECEAILREVLVEGRHAGPEGTAFARYFLGLCLGMAGRTEEAREQLTLLLGEFGPAAMGTFKGFVLTGLAWVDNQDGRYADALDRSRRALEASSSHLWLMMAPDMRSQCLVIHARALGGLGGERRAVLGARLLAAGRKLLPEGHVPVRTERQNEAAAEELLRGVLGDAAFESAYAEGGGLSREEATALVIEYRD
ncbi:BTAD domain-containing putative transcriptional regulator [Streptomyces sp. NPDC051784]|uniref:BTAD domain-containing putative transcriptional regulator n=1 Tax=Streptomyces sp. NPDC051784 TaxID=3155805 RepID=UPI0034432C00